MRGSYIALLATARPSDGGLQVEQLVAVVDAGRLVNPAIARQQVEGGLIFGLAAAVGATTDYERSEEHTSELQSLMRISYAVFCLKKKKQHNKHRQKSM